MDELFSTADLNRLYRYGLSLCHNEEDAWDLLQAGLERYLRAGPPDSAGRVPYVMRSMRNLRIDGLRRDTVVRFEPLPEGDGPVDLDLRALEELVISEEAFSAAWSKMNAAEREILFLWAVEGYSVREVAEHIHRPRNTVLSIIHRVRLRLTPGAARESKP